MIKAAATALVALGATLLVTPAQADTPGCVTRKEYYAVHKGMRMKRVNAIFDAKGMWAVSVPVKSYRICPSQDFGVHIAYRKGSKGYWRVVRKYADAE